MATEPPDLVSTWCEIVARAWDDEEYRQRVKAYPDEVLAEEGVEIPDGVRFRVVENEREGEHLVLNLVLPEPPQEIESLVDLDDVTVAQYYAACI